MDDPDIFGSDPDTARQRVEMARYLFHNIAATLTEQLRALSAEGQGDLKAIRAKQAELQTALIHCNTIERTFHDKFRDGPGDGAIDFDAARDEIGRRLDRLRAARDPG